MAAWPAPIHVTYVARPRMARLQPGPGLVPPRQGVVAMHAGTPSPGAVFEAALAEARRRGARLTLVVALPPPSGGLCADPLAYEAGALESTSVLLAAIGERCAAAGVACECLVRFVAHPARLLLGIVADRDAALVVAGTRAAAELARAGVALAAALPPILAIAETQEGQAAPAG